MLLTVAAVMVTGVVTLATVRSHTPSPLERTDADVVADALPRLEFVREALHEGAGTAMQELFPEGYFFTHALYGLTWLSVAQRDPRPAGPSVTGGPLVPQTALLPRRHGTVLLGCSPRLRCIPRGLERLAARTDRGCRGRTDTAPEEMAALDAAAEEIAEAFEASLAHGTPYLTSYPGQAWPVDNVVAMAALRLRDHLAGEDRYAALFRLWMTEVRARLDPATGLIPHRVDPVTGHPVEGARGTSQTLLLRFLFEIDPEWAAADYTVFRELFASEHAMLPGCANIRGATAPPGTSTPVR